MANTNSHINMFIFISTIFYYILFSSVKFQWCLLVRNKNRGIHTHAHTKFLRLVQIDPFQMAWIFLVRINTINELFFSYLYFVSKFCLFVWVNLTIKKIWSFISLLFLSVIIDKTIFNIYLITFFLINFIEEFVKTIFQC